MPQVRWTFWTLLFVAFLMTSVAPARAAFFPDLWFAGTRLILSHADQRDGAIAVGTTDEGLRRFLGRLGATIAYQPGQRYVVVTTSDRRTITFVLGDTRFAVENVGFTAPFAPYANRGEAFIPLFDLARALYVVPITLGQQTVLQPQLGSLDVRNQHGSIIVTLRGATALHFTETSFKDRLDLNFSGVSSTLDQSRVVGSDGLSEITVLTHGTPRAPTTTISFEGLEGATHVVYPSQSQSELVLAFRSRSLAAAPAPSSAPSAQPLGMGPPAPLVASSPLPAGGAVVTALDETPSGQGMTLHIAVNGSASYEWHRLLDNRWYVDIHNATLQFPTREDAFAHSSVASVRVKQLTDDDSTPYVRVAMSLTSMPHIEVTPSDSALTVAITPLEDSQPIHVGAGQIGPDAKVAVLPDSTPLPVSTPLPWKFGSHGAGSHLIVIDPGHGGSDTGAQQNGLTEKDITLDISQRLHDILTARGWSVKMTREKDIDVFEPNDSAHDELQARCDIANKAGAQIFVSIHVNSFTSGDLNGTTTYYYKNEDLPLAEAVHRRLVSVLDTKDDGVRKSNFYVIHHTNMPAILIETAFMSNADDAARLRSSLFLQKIANAVADGVGDYTGKQPPVTGMVEQ